MKKAVFYLLILGSIISCSRHEEDIVPNLIVQDNAIVKEITVSTSNYLFDESEQTRGLTYENGKVPFAWSVNDTLGIFPNKGDQMPFSMEEGVGTTYAKIDGGGWALKQTATYMAYSPFNRKNYYRDRQHIILDYTGQIENGIANTDHLGAYDFQASNATTAVDGKLDFQLERLSCILILRLTVPQAGSYKRVKLSAGSEIFSTEAELSLGNNYAVTPTKKAKSITLGLENVRTTEDNQVCDFLMMLAPVDMTGQSITVSLLGANGYEYKATKTLASNYSARSVKRVSFTLVIDNSANVGIGGEFEEKEDEM